MDRDGPRRAGSAKSSAPIEADLDVIRGLAIEDDAVIWRDRLGVLAPAEFRTSS